MNNIGILNKKVTIIKGTAAEFKGFETISDNILYKNIWAAIQPTTATQTFSGKESLEQQRYKNEEMVKIIIRYRDNVDEGCKVVYKNHIYDVNSIADKDMSHDTLELGCTEKKRGNTTTGTTLGFKSDEWVP